MKYKPKVRVLFNPLNDEYTVMTRLVVKNEKGVKAYQDFVAKIREWENLKKNTTATVLNKTINRLLSHVERTIKHKIARIVNKKNEIEKFPFVSWEFKDCRKTS